MAYISFSPKFLKEVIMLFKERGFKDVVLGKRALLSDKEKSVLGWIKDNPSKFKAVHGRSGEFSKVDIVHKGSGRVYLLSNKLGNENNESLILFDDDVRITRGPDLWVYLSTSQNIKKEGLGDYLKIELVKGDKGGQSYIVQKPILELEKYKSVVIWCKQFSVLFTFAPLL